MTPGVATPGFFGSRSGRLPTPTGGAALAVRRWAKAPKGNLNLAPPACVADPTHLGPVETYTTPKLDQCDEYYNPTPAGAGMVAPKGGAGINYCCNRGLLGYKGAKPPTPFGANPRGHLATTHEGGVLGNPRYWPLLDTVEGCEAMGAGANAKCGRLAQTRRGGAMGTPRGVCLRAIGGGLPAPKAHWRLGTKQNAVGQLMGGQQRAIKRRGVQVQTGEVFGGVDFNGPIAFGGVQ